MHACSFGPSVAFLAFASLVGGCVIPKSIGDDPPGTESSGGGDGPSGPTSGVTAGSTGGGSGQVSGTTGDPAPSDDTAGSESTDGGFIMMGDGGIGDPCDPWLQDCPEGEKCVPFGPGPDEEWTTWRCSPIVEMPDAVGETCTVEGSEFSGIDTCELGAFCWEVDSGTLEGTCVALCTGPEDFPSCPGTDTCFIGVDGILTLCLPSCDPLLQDCAPDQACHPGHQGFACLPDDLGGGQPGDPCVGVGPCSPGSVCVAPEQVPDCGPQNCCTSLCTVGEPMPPCLPEQVCTPWFEAGMAPAGLEDVGYCALP